MRIKLTFTIFLAVLALQLSAQDSYIKNRWNVELAYKPEVKLKNSTPFSYKFYHLGVDYGLTKHFELGLNTAYSRSKLGTDHWLKYNLNCNFHFLPFFVESEDFRFDLYLTGKGGGITIFQGPYTIVINGIHEDKPASRSHNIYFGLGTGVAFYPFKHTGFFTEITYENYHYSKSLFLKYGLSVKF